MEDQSLTNGHTSSGSEVRIAATAVSRGIGIGRVVFLNGERNTPFKIKLTQSQIEYEIARFRDALQRAVSELRSLSGHSNEAPESASDIFGVHLLILESSSFVPSIESTIRDQLINAEWAVRSTADGFAEKQRSLPDQHIRDKYLDVEDVADRLLRALGTSPASEQQKSDTVFVATELRPSKLMELARLGPTAVISEHGGWTSHASILARELNLPVVTGIKDLNRVISAGECVIVDAINGEVILRPTKQTIERFRTYAQPSVNEVVVESGSRAAITQDGVEIVIRANADFPEIYRRAKRLGARGIGLFRSELILNLSRGIPSEREQIEIYAQIADAAGDEGVKIRTFDVGADYFGSFPNHERNPCLGLRSLRWSLTERLLFKTQIRAILQAAAGRKIDIVFPMISGVSDLLAARRITDEERANLGKQGRAIGEVGIGAMIEVPSAVFTVNEIARHVDFMLLGTNDLVQYMLAVDRDNEAVAGWYQTLHPAVVRAIREILAAGRDCGIPVIVCGEVAGSPFYVPLLLGLGAFELSMSLSSIPKVRKLITGLNVTSAVELANSIDTLVTADEIERFLRSYYIEKWPNLFPAGLLEGAKAVPSAS